MPESVVPLVLSQRADVVETVHRGALSVVDVEGNVIASQGDPDGVYFVRSSCKPLQALAAAEAGAFDRFEYTDAQIALSASSHSGEVAHISELRSTMEKVGIAEGDLICGLAWPLYERRRDEMVRAGEQPTRLHNNCSAKHAAMIAAAKAQGDAPETYWRLDHPHQQRILRLIAELADLTTDQIQIGVDGCGVPTHAIPLRAMALAFARLADPSALGDERAAACRRVTQAMTRYPYLVAGSERFDTVLLATGEGRIVCKGGAQGYFAAGMHVGDVSTPALGLALKIEDGNHVAACQAALEAIDQMGLLEEQHRWRLESWQVRPVLNTRGETVGATRSVFDLMFRK